MLARVTFGLLWCFILVLPWDALPPFPVVGSVPRIVGLVASAVGILHILARRQVRALTWFHVFAVLFVLWAGVTGFWSVDPGATRALVVTYLQLLVLIWLLWEIAWSPERQRALLEAYVLGASVAALFTIHNFLAGANFALSTDTRYAALNQDPNELGLTLALGIPMAWYVSLLQPGSRARWLWRLYLPLAITGVLLTASRGATAATLLALTIVPLTQSRLRRSARAALIGLAVGTAVVAMVFVPATSLERIGTAEADVESGHFGGRGTIWEAGLEVAREHPLVGVGAGAFQVAVEPAIHQEMVAHDVPLSILVCDGAIGLCLFLAMVVGVVQPLRRLPRLQCRFSIVLMLTLAFGTLSLSWDNRKQFWFVLGFLAVQVAQWGLRGPEPRRAGARLVRPTPARAMEVTSPPSSSPNPR